MSAGAAKGRAAVDAGGRGGLLADVWGALRHNPRAVFGLVVIGAIVVCALLAPVLAPYDPNAISLREAKQPPSLRHPLGTDLFGRDILSRLIYGARISLRVGVISQGLSLVIGVVLGSLAGYFRGRVDDVVTFLINVFWSFPGLLFVLAFAAATRPSIEMVYVALALIGWVGVARIVRGQFLALRETEFVEAARACGAGPARIIFRHILPNSLGPVIVVLSMGFAGAILAEASLSFLGLGAQPPTPSWGTMIDDGFRYIATKWWLALFPGAAVTLAVMAFNLFGEGLNDALDPRLRANLSAWRLSRKRWR